MTAADIVDGDGWISDESDFYGNENARSALEGQVGRGHKHCLSSSVPQAPRKKQKVTANVGIELQFENRLTSNGTVHQMKPPETATVQDGQSISTDSVKPTVADEAAELFQNDHHKQNLAAWQQGETIDKFLTRLPVEAPETARVGPWLWVSSASTNSEKQQRLHTSDSASFIAVGSELLEQFSSRRLKVEAEHEGKAAATITRYMGPYRDKLEQNLLDEAIRTGTTCGKWLLFPSNHDLPRYWRLIAKATSEGKLGPVAKVATYDPTSTKGETLICVYTYDFSDVDDVRRVLEALVDLRVCSRDGKAIYYKCDAYTYLGIQSSNPYRLKASLYSSPEIWAGRLRVQWPQKLKR